MASHLVDMVHFCSPVMENNELMRVRAKGKYWDGIVVPYEDIAHYIDEDDAILIGPGMERGDETRRIVNNFLKKYPHKKWVVDGGALQEVDPSLLTEHMIITPNHKELQLLKSKISNSKLHIMSTVLAKGETDTITPSLTASRSHGFTDLRITGGSPGLTKGGTGDVLAGLVLGLAAKSPSFASCVIASYCLKHASELLSDQVGPYFSPTQLISQIPKSLHSLFKS
jgi:NAD(P)H-hydrate epimerase